MIKLNLAIGAAALLVGYLAGVGVANNNWVAKWADAEREAAQSQLNAVNSAVEAYRLRVTELEKVNDETKQQLADAFVAARNADAESDRLQRALDDYLRGSSGTTEPTPVARECAAIATDRLVLADLFRRADKRAGELAAVADAARIRGLACQRAYNVVGG